jgi:hypothetical protein
MRSSARCVLGAVMVPCGPGLLAPSAGAVVIAPTVLTDDATVNGNCTLREAVRTRLARRGHVWPLRCSRTRGGSPRPVDGDDAGTVAGCDAGSVEIATTPVTPPPPSGATPPATAPPAPSTPTAEKCPKGEKLKKDRCVREKKRRK